MTLPPDHARRILDTLTAYQRSAALACALELDLFTKVDDGKCDVSALASACGVSERGIRSLCDYLVAERFLAKTDGSYHLEEHTGPFLSRRSERSLASVATFLHGDTLRSAYARLGESVRQGSTALSEQGTMETEHQTWVDFARGMAPVMAPQAELLARMLAERGVTPERVLDVASGHGLYGLAAARRWSRAHVVLQDWAPVLEVAREHARGAGLESRVEYLQGDVRALELGGPFDLVLVTQFLHHFPPAECVAILRRLRSAMTPGATLAVLEMLVDDSRVTPTHIARFSLVLLATTNGGDAFTPEELGAMVSEAGFERVEVAPLADAESRVMLARAP